MKVEVATLLTYENGNGKVALVMKVEIASMLNYENRNSKYAQLWK